MVQDEVEEDKVRLLGVCYLIVSTIYMYIGISGQLQ